MGIYRKGNVYLIDYYYKGRRIRESAGPSRAFAKQALLKRQAEIAEGKFYPERLTQGITFGEFAQKFWDLYGRHKRSAKNYKQMLNWLVGYMGNKRLTDINSPCVLEMRATLKQKAATSTVNRYHALLRCLIYRAIEWGDYHGDNAAAKVRTEREAASRLRFLSHEEISRLLEVCDKRIYPVVACALLTGMRRGEMLGLRWENVDLNTGIIYILESKSGKSREIMISPKLAKIFEKIGPRPEGPVFTVTRMTLRRCWERALRDANIQNFVFHDLRHTFASNFIMKTSDLPALQKILGHSTPVMTQKYAHLSKGHMAVNMLTFDSGMDTYWTPRDFVNEKNSQKYLSIKEFGPVAQW
ncbi:MAG: tyrosine-type recombinase/integrase [Elusimicrobia bacterium]|nr:tyrosine-type recombinase/integrase [Elusimicrobiota bacterium]